MGCRKLDILDKNQHGLKVVHKASAVKLKRCADAWRWEYYIKDHLGNIRLSFSDLNDDGEITVALDETNEILEENHYYPFGLKQNGPWLKRKDQGFKNKYNYNGKEEMPFTGYLYYGTRIYDPSMARFTGVDLISDQYPIYSTFNYAGNSPITNVDLHGLQPMNFQFVLFKQRAKKVLNNFNSTRTGMNNAMRTLQNGQEPNVFQKAGNAVTAFNLHFGNFTSQNDASVLMTGSNLDGSSASGGEKALAGAFIALPISGGAVKKLLGKGAELLGKFVGKFTNQASHLDAKHIKAAVGDIMGNPITLNGKTYDHLDEVENALGGIGKQLGKLNKEIGAGSFSDDALQAAKNLRSTLQRQKDEITDVLNRARKKAGE